MFNSSHCVTPFSVFLCVVSWFVHLFILLFILLFLMLLQSTLGTLLATVNSYRKEINKY